MAIADACGSAPFCLDTQRFAELIAINPSYRAERQLFAMSGCGKMADLKAK
jgi:hypothetical protein